MKPTPKPSWNPERLDVRAFAQAGTTLQSVDPLTRFERLVAEAHGVSRTVVAYSWLMAHPAGIIPIIGSQSPSRIAEGSQALTVRWTRTEWYAVLVAARGVPLP